MHTRRISTFLLGGWIGCSVFMAFIVLQNLHAPSLILNAPVEPVARMTRAVGQEQMALLLHHQAAEQTRNLYYLWEQAQVILALVLGICLYFATQKRTLSLVLCGVMVSLVMFQLFAVTPELNFRGRESDFVSNASNGAVVRTLLLYQMLVVTEGMKLLVGGILASYLFAFRTSRKRGGRRELDVVDHPDHSHIDRGIGTAHRGHRTETFED